MKWNWINPGFLRMLVWSPREAKFRRYSEVETWSTILWTRILQEEESVFDPYWSLTSGLSFFYWRNLSCDQLSSLSNFFNSMETYFILCVRSWEELDFRLALAKASLDSESNGMEWLFDCLKPTVNVSYSAMYIKTCIILCNRIK